MVDYPALPGQSGFVGNAAAGAALLNELQNSPLSGAYTAFNYYLQSAIDAGTLGGVQRRWAARCTPTPRPICCASRSGSMPRSRPMPTAATLPRGRRASG